MDEQELLDRLKALDDRQEGLEKDLRQLVAQIDEFVKLVRAAFEQHRQALNAIGGVVESLQRREFEKTEEFFGKLLFYAEQTQRRPM